MHKNFGGFSFLASGLALAAMFVAACSGDAGISPAGSESDLTARCRRIQSQLVSGANRDGIPALTDPDFVLPDSPAVDFLLPTDRVIGIEIDGEFVAVPHNILWWHEIADLNDYGLAVTYCPLTGTSFVFQRDVVGGAEFGVSGLLFKNNLVMFDRTGVEGEESLWPQMLGGAFSGPSEGKRLSIYPAIELEWEDWQALHPGTRVVTSQTGFERNYALYPYGNYEMENNGFTLFPTEDLDPRRPPKERVLGIPFAGGGAMVFPFGALGEVGDLAVVHTILGDGEEGQGGVDEILVFWDGGAAAARAFRPWTLTQGLTFEVRDGAFVDVVTGSEWSIEGRAISGPLEGERLVEIPVAYVSFWFAFSELYPNPVLWLP